MAAEDEFKDEAEQRSSVETAPNETVGNVETVEPQQSDETVDVVDLSFDDDEASLKAESAIEKHHARLIKLSSQTDRPLYASIKASLNVESAYGALCGSLASISADRSLYGSVFPSAWATVDMSSAFRSSLAGIGIDMDRSVRGLTASALAGVDMSTGCSALRNGLSSLSVERPRYGSVFPSARATVDMSRPFWSSLAGIGIDIDRSVRGLTASALAGMDMSSGYGALRNSLSSLGADRLLHGSVFPSAWANVDMSSAFRSSLAGIRIDLDRSVSGLTASALAGIDMPGAFRSSLGSISIVVDPSLRGLTASALAGIDMSSGYSALRNSFSGLSVGWSLSGGIAASVLADIDLRNFYGSVAPSIRVPHIDELPPLRYRAKEAVRSEEDRIHQDIGREDLSILITFPAANEREVRISVVQMSAAYRLLHCLEVRLREVIPTLMEAKFGPDWVRTRVPASIAADWEEKKTKAEQKGFLGSRLLDYADFSDYRGIIIQRRNWREVFESIFGNHKDTEVSFERLEPLRIETMHNRPLSRGDAAVLATEVCRLMCKLDRSILN
jgi:hypothetical protein